MAVIIAWRTMRCIWLAENEASKLAAQLLAKRPRQAATAAEDKKDKAEMLELSIRCSREKGLIHIDHREISWKFLFRCFESTLNISK